jgi:hypothetical protein
MRELRAQDRVLGHGNLLAKRGELGHCLLELQSSCLQFSVEGPAHSECSISFGGVTHATASALSRSWRIPYDHALTAECSKLNTLRKIELGRATTGFTSAAANRGK